MKILFGKLEQQTQPSRPRRIWKGNIKMDLKGILQKC